jgi:hypothetical protein
MLRRSVTLTDLGSIPQPDNKTYWGQCQLVNQIKHNKETYMTVNNEQNCNKYVEHFKQFLK